MRLIGTELANIAQCVEHLTTFTCMEQDKYLYYRLGVLGPSIFGGNVRVSPTLSYPDPRSLSVTDLSSSNAWGMKLSSSTYVRDDGI